MASSPIIAHSIRRKLLQLAAVFLIVAYFVAVMDCSMRAYRWLGVKDGDSAPGLVFPFIAAIALPYWWEKHRRNRRLKNLHWHDCPRCKYDLTGNTSGICSECGAPAPHIATVICETCETPWTFPSQLRGTQQKCPKCGIESIIPSAVHS